MLKSILLDTSFFIRLLNSEDKLHNNTKEYFKYFLENEFHLICSTISVGEYCVKGDINDLPIVNVQILPYNFNHALKAAEFAKILFDDKDIKSENRLIIQNDVKLFAQAEIESSILFYITSDSKSKNLFNKLYSKLNLTFKFIDLKDKPAATFGMLDFSKS